MIVFCSKLRSGFMSFVIGPRLLVMVVRFWMSFWVNVFVSSMVGIRMSMKVATPMVSCIGLLKGRLFVIR